MRKSYRRWVALMVFMLVMVMIPVCGFAAEDVSDNIVVTVDKNDVSVTEGKIHKDSDAVITVSAETTGSVPGGTKLYEWYSCDSSGKIIKKVDNRYILNFGVQFRVPEELTEGTYYYLCKVKYLKGASDEIIGEKKSDVVTVNVADGIPVVIFDPTDGSFAESINNREPIDIEIGASGKIEGSLPIPGKENSMFIGWYTANVGGEQVDFDNKVFNRTTRLYARYAMRQEAIFDANGGAFNNGEEKYSVEFAQGYLLDENLPDNPTRKGYEFVGWYFKGAEGEEYKLTLFEGMNGYELYEEKIDIYAKWIEAEEEPERYDENSKDNDLNDENSKDNDLNKEDSKETLDKSPATGDDSNMTLWGITAATVALIAASMKRRRA